MTTGRVEVAVPGGGGPRHLTRTVAGTLAACRFSAMTAISQSRSGIVTRNSRVPVVAAPPCASWSVPSAGRPSTSARTFVTGAPGGARIVKRTLTEAADISALSDGDTISTTGGNWSATLAFGVTPAAPLASCSPRSSSAASKTRATTSGR